MQRSATCFSCQIKTVLQLATVMTKNEQRRLPLHKDFIDSLQTSLLLLLVGFSMLFKRVFDFGERSRRPVESRDIKLGIETEHRVRLGTYSVRNRECTYLVDCFGARSRQTTESPTVKSRSEGKDGELGSARCLVVHHTLWSIEEPYIEGVRP